MLRFDKVEIKDKDAILRFIEDNSRKFDRQFYHSPRLKEKTIVEGEFSEVIEKLQNGFGLCARNDLALKALGIITDSRWDSKILSKRIGKITLYNLMSKEETRSFLQKVCLKAKEIGFDAVFGRTDLEQIDTLQAALLSGAVLGDILLTWSMNIHGQENKRAPAETSSVDWTHLIFEEATAADEGKLEKITESAYKHSHYFNDPNISSEMAETVYKEWIRNSLRGFADLAVVARLKGEIVGYITFRVAKLNARAFGTIDLIAVDKEYRGQGIGKMLVIEGIKRISSRIDTLLASTQVSNLPALRLYHGLGFKPIRTEATFHFWFVTQEKVLRKHTLECSLS